MRRTTPRRPSPVPEEAGLPDPAVHTGGLDAPLDLRELFGTPEPPELEVGFGKGRFLLAESAARPATPFLGIESSHPYVRLMRHRLLERGTRNVRIVGGRAGDVLRRLVPESSLAVIYVLFPDPWPKRRHHKRRLVTADFLALAASRLVPGGTLHVVTDHDGYAAWIAEAADRVAALAPRDDSPFARGLAGRTHYAARLAARGARFHARAWERRR